MRAVRHFNVVPAVPEPLSALTELARNLHWTWDRETQHLFSRLDPDAWKEAGHEREPRVSVSRSIFPLVNDLDRAYFGHDTQSRDQVGHIDGGIARFGKSYAGEPDQLVKELAEDEAVAAADTLLLTVPNQLGVDYNAHVLDAILRYVAPELGWR